uniref:Uncharacterized protein n=1 Tax=Zea mays TaxID=4577 RepID=C4J4I9_MAIZE|nr:unknown [Zea mays]
MDGIHRPISTSPDPSSYMNSGKRRRKKKKKKHLNDHLVALIISYQSSSSSSSAGEEEAGRLVDGVVEPPPGLVHELGAEAHHEDAELRLAERAVAVEVALGEHPAEVGVRHAAQAQQRRVAAEAVEGDEPARRVHQQPEPARQLPHQPVLAQPLRHHRQVVLEAHGGGRRRRRSRLLLPLLRRHVCVRACVEG